MDTSYHSSDPYYVESTVNKYKNKYGVEIVYLDYIQLLTERDEGQTQEIGRLTRLFKLLSNDLNICSVLLSQLNRNLESRDDKRPLLSDMRQSGSIEEDADFVLGLYRDEAYNKETKYKGIIENIVLKNRNGPIGTVSLKFDGPTNRISEA
jgi:replicative DNA helicase